MIRWTFLILFLFAAATIIACGKDNSPSDATATQSGAEKTITGLSPEQAAKVVAKVGDQKITVGDVTEQINRLSPYIKRRWATPEKRKELLQKLIQIELLSQEAISQGLDNSPEVQRAVKQVMVRLLVKNDLQKELFPTSVDEQILKKEYETNWLKYHTAAQHRMSQIVVHTEAEAKQHMKEILAAPSPRGIFRDLARSVSIDEESRSHAGDIGYITNPADIAKSAKNGENRAFVQTEGVGDQIAKAAWTLKQPNEIYPTPIKTDQGYHILMLTTVRPELNRSFNSVKRLIESRLLRGIKKEKMDFFVATLKKKSNVKIYKENLEKVQLDLDPKDNEALHPDTDTLSNESDTTSLDAPTQTATAVKNPEKSNHLK